MDRLSNKSQKIILNLIYFTFVFILVYLFGLIIYLDLNISLQIFMVFVGSMMVKFIIFNPLILYILLAIGFLVSIIVNRYITPFTLTFSDRIFILFQNILNNLQGKENIAENNILLFWGMLIILVSFFTAFILFKGKNIYLLLPIYLGFFLSYWYNFFDQAYWMIVIFLIAFFILMGLDKYIKEENKVKNSINSEFTRIYTPWVQTVIMYSILIVSIALILPKSHNYLQWPWLQDKVYTAFPFVEELRSYNSFSRKTGEATLFNFTITGYQGETSRLGGPVILSDKKIMTVYADSSNYLRGNVRQIYTGNVWETINEPSEKYGIRQDFSGLSEEEKKLYYEENEIIIINHAFASKTLFSPYKPAKVNFIDNFWVIVNRDDSLVFSEGVYDTESYYITVQSPLPYGILVSLGIDNKKEDLANLEIYLQTPEDRITDQTKNLVKEIVAGKESDYEKAVAIENYLRNNYSYNLNANEVPENREFIDYFLFEGKEGYCTYFATTMAIMLRLEGIPTRYVEGYLAHESVETGIYEVTHENAHAWVEVYIEPVGWMTFEPTPAYAVESRLENYEPDPEEIIDPVDASDNINPIDDFDAPKFIKEEDILDSGYSPDIENPYEEIQTDLTRNVVIIIISILLLIIPVRFLIGFIKYKYNEAKAKKLPNNNRIIYLYKQILLLTKLLHYPQKYGETHYEYASRVAYKFYEHNKKGIKEITEIFVMSKYSNYISTDQDVLELENFRETLDRRLENHLGHRAYYYRKYVKKDKRTL